MIQQQLFTLLSGATEAGTRVFPLVAPDGVPRPYIVYQRVSAISENVLSGDAGLTNTRFQIDVYSDTYTVAAGNTYSVIAGCTKRFSEDCVAKFANGNNFRGFPHVPGVGIWKAGGVV